MRSEIINPDELKGEAWGRYVQEHRNPFYTYPEDRVVLIWRYMDLGKLVSILDSSSLFFPRSDLLGDPFEGSVSAENLRNRKIEIDKAADFFHAGLVERGISSSIEGQQANMERLLGSGAKQLEWKRFWTYVSCWHVNEHESSAMWKIYGATQQSVAIVSTFQSLLDVLVRHVSPPQGEPRVSLVKYLDYENEAVFRGAHLSEFFCKRKSFEYEREVRAVVQNLPLLPEISPGSRPYDYGKPPLPGISFQVDLAVLIKEIRISPSSPDWFSDVVKSVVKKYRVGCPVVRSDMDKNPAY